MRALAALAILPPLLVSVTAAAHPVTKTLVNDYKNENLMIVIEAMDGSCQGWRLDPTEARKVTFEAPSDGPSEDSFRYLHVIDLHPKEGQPTVSTFLASNYPVAVGHQFIHVKPNMLVGADH